MSTFTGLNEVQIIPATTRRLGLPSEVLIGRLEGVDDLSVLNAQLLQLIPSGVLSVRLGMLGDDRMAEVCRAVKEAIGC